MTLTATIEADPAPLDSTSDPAPEQEEPSTGPSGPSDPEEPTDPKEPKAPTGPMSAAR